MVMDEIRKQYEEYFRRRSLPQETEIPPEYILKQQKKIKKK